MRQAVARVILAAAAAVALSGGARAEAARFADEARRDPSLMAARRDFIAALEQRNEAALRRLLDPKIGVGNGGEGPDDLIKLLRERPAFADEFVAILRLGGRFSGPNLFLVPYTAKPSYSEKDEERLFARKPGVVLRAAPRDDAPVARALGHAVVKAKFDDALQKQGWVEIVGPAGYAGFVRDADVFFVGQAFIHFGKVRGRWLVVRAY